MYRIFLIQLAMVMTLAAQAQQMSYRVGEKLDYSISYGVLQGGVASLQIVSDTYMGKSVWHAKLLGKTTGVADAFFKVNDIYETYIDPATELPLLSVRNISEGRYRKYNEVIFDHKTRKDSAILISDLTGVHITQQGIHDILSCFYYIRNHYLPYYDTLKKGDMITIMTWFTDELYPIKMRFKGVEEIRTKAGRLRCLKFNPVTEVGRLFKTEEDISFWFTADKNFLPVRIRFNIFVGAFTVEMVKYEGLVSPIEHKLK